VRDGYSLIITNNNRGSKNLDFFFLIDSLIDNKQPPDRVLNLRIPQKNSGYVRKTRSGFIYSVSIWEVKLVVQASCLWQAVPHLHLI